MKNIQLRSYQKSDQDDVWRLHVEGLNQTGSFIPDPALDADLSNIPEIYLEKRGEFLMAIIEEKVVGMGALRNVDQKTAEIKRMRIDKDYQRQGIGSMLLQALMEKGKMLGYERLILDTSIRQEAAQKLYEKFGFKEYKRAKIADLESRYYKYIFS